MAMIKKPGKGTRKKSKAQAIRDAEGTGMALDAYGVDKEEGRLVKDSKGRTKAEFNPKTRKKRRGKVQAKSVGGDVMGTIRSRAKKAGFMTGQDDMRDIKEYLINERNKKMFDDAEKKEKKKKAKSKRRKPSKSTLDAARKAASSIRMKKGGYTSQNKKYGGGIYPKMGK